MAPPDVQRDLGRMEAQIETLVEQVAQLNTKVADIQTTLSEARGGWRTLLWVAGAAGTIGAGLSYLASLLTLKPGP